MPAFTLSKWYLDYITDLGEAVIIYTGSVHWGLVRLHYSSILEASDCRITERHSLRPHDQPEASDSVISWRSQELNFHGTWNAASVAVREKIYDSGDGSIDWHCRMPLARVASREATGWGYAEHLTMTIPPWKLPLRSLRWGRFTSASDSVTWIDWQGDFSRRLVFQNGHAVACLKIEDDRLDLDDDTHLLLDRSLILRDGPLGTKALSGIPGVGKMFPARLLEMSESKWRSKACLERKGRPAVEGWAIHEKVGWAR
jgi:hypothetical protein